VHSNGIEKQLSTNNNQHYTDHCGAGKLHELSYRKQIVRQLRIQYLEGLYSSPVTFKSRLWVSYSVFFKTSEKWLKCHCKQGNAVPAHPVIEIQRSHVPLEARERSSCTSSYWDPAFPHLLQGNAVPAHPVIEIQRSHTSYLNCIQTSWAQIPVGGQKTHRSPQLHYFWFSTLTNGAPAILGPFQKMWGAAPPTIYDAYVTDAGEFTLMAAGNFTIL